MQQTCPRCGSVIDGNSRFCTNCGNVLAAEQGYRQSWEAPRSPVPSWASSQPYQQPASAQYSGPGSRGPNAQTRRLLTIAASIIGGALLLLVVSIAMVVVGPASTRGFFLVVALLLILIPWIIYHQIRRFIRRTVGRMWWFL